MPHPDPLPTAPALPELVLSDQDVASLPADAVVVGLYTGEDGPVAADATFAPIVPAARLAGASGTANAVTVLPAAAAGLELAAERLVTVGLGAAPSGDGPTTAHRDRVRSAAGAVSRALAGRSEVVSTLGAIDLAAAIEGHLLGGYVFDTYKKPREAPVGRIVLAGVDPAAGAAVHEQAAVGAQAAALARSFINTAPNDLFPAAFADRAVEAAQALGLEVEVLDEKALAAGGYGGILGVGGGSSRPPRLVRIAWNPAAPTATVALVGKGITFDSGGLSIKPAAKMDQMTSDMSGAAAVIATVLAAARLELPVRVIAYAALAENLPSATAYRPGDVLRHYGGDGPGKTVHVLNTDAEGRLVLADALVRAGQDEPDAILETSTLTGAQVVALGKRTMGVMGEPGLRDRVAELARSVGEGAWAMPLPEHLGEGLDSPLADLQNIAGDPGGGMLVAGHYLSRFVPDGLPWVHLDVAGPAFHDGKPYGHIGTGGTGVPVRTLLATLRDIAEHGVGGTA